MNLEQLRAFLTVAEAGGFTKAATHLASTQPTLSRQVKALESELGRPLLDRLGRRVELTDYGRYVARRAQAILAQTDALAASGRGPIAETTGLLRLGAADSVVLGRFPKILKRFRRKYPGVREHVRTGSSPDILRWLHEGNCDAGLCMIPRTHPGLVLRELWTDGMVALVPSNHRLAGKRARLDSFAAERQIAIHQHTLSHQLIVSAFQSAGLTYVPDMVFETFHLLVEFVAAGVGVGISSAEVAGPALRRRQVARVRIREIDGLSRRLGLALHADRAVDGPLAAFLGELTAK